MSVSAIQAGRDTNRYSYSVTKLTAGAEIGRKDGRFSMGGEAAAVKYQGNYTFNAFSKKITIGGTAALGSIGAKVSAGKRSF